MTIHVLAWLLSYLFNALWQIPLLFAAAWIVARALRRFGPQTEHRVWVAALLLQITLPACNFRIPALWNALLSLLPSHSASASGSVRVFFVPTTIVGNRLQLPFALETGIVIAWAAIVLYFVLRLIWGLVQTRRFTRMATSADLPEDAVERWVHYCAQFYISSPPQIAVSSQATAPVVIGMRRGMVLLPPQMLDTVQPGDLDAVLAHELAHIARRDFAKNLLYSFLSLPITWHPLAWRTRACLAETRELICDDSAAATVAGRKQYAQSLLRLASRFAGQPRFAMLQAVGILDFSTSSALERRVMSLTRKHIPFSTSRRILLAGACFILALATCTSALALHTDISELAPDAQQSTLKTVQVSAKMMSGNRISGNNPVYPPEARKKKIQGTVVIDTTISKEGTIEDLHVIKTPDPSLAESALKAIRTWRYRPYLLNGNPVAVQTTVNVTFCIDHPCKLPG